MIAPGLPPGPGAGDFCDALAAALLADGYAVLDQALPASLLDDLYVACNADGAGVFLPAGIGREQDHRLNHLVRTDRIRWLGRDARPATDAYLAWAEALRLALNRRLYLGLFDHEAHFALYGAGDYYRRHVDAFRGRSNRVLTTVLYLNPDWGPDDGGELVIYAAADSTQVLAAVTPSYGRLVVFLSERFPHEVLPARRVRRSIAGWYRGNGNPGHGAHPPR